MDHQKPISLTAHPTTNRPDRQCRTNHGGRHPMGIQHSANSGRRPTQGSFRNQSRTLRTDSDVLRTHQLPSDVPNHDGHHISRTNRSRNPHGLHGRHSRTHKEGGKRNRRSTPAKASTIGKRNAHHLTKAQPLPQHRQVPVRKTGSRLPGSPHRRKKRHNGRSQDRTSKELETPPKRDRSTTLPGIHGVLSVLHQRILTNSSTAPRSDQEKHRVALGRTPTASLRRTKGQNVQQTCADTPRPGQNILPSNGRVNKRSRSGTNPRSRRDEETKTDSLLLRNLLPGRRKLRHL